MIIVLKIRTLALSIPITLALTAGQAFATTITFNGSPLQLDEAPIVQAGRVFVPLRGVFEALGASVVYQNGTINATRREKTVSLHVGSNTATISGAQQTLDASPFIVGETTYVPLRFVAQALGAYVGYNDATSTVSIDRHDQPQALIVQHAEVVLRNASPANGDAVHERQPTISANFSRPVDPNSVHVSLDGLDISTMTTRSRSGIVYEPGSPLQSMSHQVALAGHDTDGRRFLLHWTFATGVPEERDGLRIDELNDGTSVTHTFTVHGQTEPGAHVRIACGAVGKIQHGDGIESGQFAADTFADEHGHFAQSVIANAPPGGAVTLVVTSTNPKDGHEISRTRHLRVAP